MLGSMPVEVNNHGSKPEGPRRAFASLVRDLVHESAARAHAGSPKPSLHQLGLDQFKLAAGIARHLPPAEAWREQ